MLCLLPFLHSDPSSTVPSGAELLSRSSGADSPFVQEVSSPEPTYPDVHGKVTLGASDSFGNTEIRSASLNSEATLRLNDTDRVTGGFDWFYSEEKDSLTKQRTLQQRRVRGFGQYDRFLNERLYLYARLDAQGDGKQQLKIRAVGTVGGGYQLWEEDSSSWRVEIGLAYTHEDFKLQPADEFVSGRLATKYSRKMTGDLSYDLSLEWLPGFEDPDDQLALGAQELGLSFGKGFVSTLRHEFDYDNTPGAGKERLDQRIIMTLGYTF
ncbi:MAG: YdiY family protein [Planctomycetota bacterium]